jgi:predicted exporter
MSADAVADELGVPTSSPAFRAWRWLLRVPVPIAVAVMIGAAVLGLG